MRLAPLCWRLSAPRYVEPRRILLLRDNQGAGLQASPTTATLNGEIAARDQTCSYSTRIGVICWNTSSHQIEFSLCDATPKVSGAASASIFFVDQNFQNVRERRTKSRSMRHEGPEERIRQE